MKIEFKPSFVSKHKQHADLLHFIISRLQGSLKPNYIKKSEELMKTRTVSENPNISMMIQYAILFLKHVQLFFESEPKKSKFSVL